MAGRRYSFKSAVRLAALAVLASGLVTVIPAEPVAAAGPGRSDLLTATHPIAVAAGLTHTCALLDNGAVKCWGENYAGQLGLGDTVQRGGYPGTMGDNLAAVDLGAGRTATAITVGQLHTCALLDNGRVKCWGENYAGQLGQGDTIVRGDDASEMGDNLPAVDLGTGRTATKISAGVGATCALLDDGSVKCWGWDSFNGQLGLGLGHVGNQGDQPGEMGDQLPAVALGTGRTATAVALGEDHACALLDNGTVKCWGENYAGQLGLGDTVQRGGYPGTM